MTNPNQLAAMYGALLLAAPILGTGSVVAPGQSVALKVMRHFTHHYTFRHDYYEYRTVTLTQTTTQYVLVMEYDARHQLTPPCIGTQQILELMNAVACRIPVEQ